MKSNIVLVEPCLNGHRAGYLSAFINGFIKLGCRVHVLCPNIGDYGEYFDRFKSSVSFVEFDLSLNPSKTKWILRKEARDYLKILTSRFREIENQYGIHIDLAFFCMIDFLMGKSLFSRDIEQCFPYSFSGIYFHPVHFRMPIKFANLRFGPFKIDAPLYARNCKGFMLLDESVAKLYRNKGANAFLIPDFSINDDLTDPRTISEKIKTLANGRKIICLVGCLQKRKGILSLLRAANELPVNKFYFIIVGEIVEETYNSEEMKELKQLLQLDHVHTQLGYLSKEEEINEYIENSDVLFAAYENFCHSSNMLIKASIFQVPLIVSDGYLMSEQVRRYSLGAIVQESDVEAIVSVLSEKTIWKLKHSDSFKGGCIDYSRFHSRDKIKGTFQQMLQL
tara:strand:- start:11436 stop:12617 length:1182 start_codon:yes stop_codon:yes gene_type:complete